MKSLGKVLSRLGQVGLIWVWFSPFSSFVDFGILSLIIGDLCFAIFKSKFPRSKIFHLV